MAQPITSQAKKISNVPLLLTAFSSSVTTGGAIYAFGGKCGVRVGIGMLLQEVCENDL